MKSLVHIILVFAFCFSANGQKAVGNIDTASTLENVFNNPSKKRYRLEDKRKNYFKLKKRKFIQVEIPVTDKTLKVQEAHNISSDNLNAVLIWVKGKNMQTGCKVVKSLKKRIKMNTINGLTSQLLPKSEKLLVAIFNNNELLESDINRFKNLIQNSKVYKEAVEQLNIDNQCARGMYYRPKESGGDVIGGKY